MTAEPLATVTDLSHWLAGDGGTAVAAAQSLVRDYCQWHVAPVVEETRLLDVDEWNVSSLWLPTLRLVSVESVTLYDETELDVDTDYTWTENGELCRWYWPARKRAVTVVFTHGFDQIPEVVQAVVLSVAARAKASPSGEVRSQEQTGPFSESKMYSQPGFNVAGGIALLDHERTALDPYVIRDS